MTVKIATFGLILKNPKYDKENFVSAFIKNGFEKKYFKMGLMKAYHKDGTEIPTRPLTIDLSDKYQLRGNLLSIAFTGDDILVHRQFDQNTSEISYDLQEYVSELESVLQNLMDCLTFEIPEFELMLMLTASSSKNPKESFAKWENKLLMGYDNPSREPGSDRIAFPGTINNRCTTKNIMVRDGEYVVELRFESKDWKDLLEDFKNSEKIGTDMILELENED